MAKLDATTVVIDVSGGVVQAVFSDAPVTVVVVDWDDIRAGGAPGRHPRLPLSELPPDTRAQAHVALARDPEET